MILRTERLIIRPWTHEPADLLRMVDMYIRPELTRILGPFVEPPPDVVGRWRKWMDDDPRQVVAAIEVRATGQVAGTVLYKPLPGEQHMEVGWHLHPDSFRRGYATEAGRAVVERGFRLGVPEVFAVIRPDNPRSQAVARRVGMRHLGRTRRYYNTDMELFHLKAPRTIRGERPEVASWSRRHGATGSAIDL